MASFCQILCTNKSCAGQNIMSLSGDAWLTCSCKIFITSRVYRTASPVRGPACVCKVHSGNTISIMTFSLLRFTISLQLAACLKILLKTSMLDCSECLITKWSIAVACHILTAIKEPISAVSRMESWEEVENVSTNWQMLFARSSTACLTESVGCRLTADSWPGSAPGLWGEETEGAAMRVQCVCQLIHNRILCSGFDGRIERRCHTHSALLDIHTLLNESLKLKFFRTLLTVSGVVPENDSWK